MSSLLLVTLHDSVTFVGEMVDGPAGMVAMNNAVTITFPLEIQQPPFLSAMHLPAGLITSVMNKITLVPKERVAFVTIVDTEKNKDPIIEMYNNFISLDKIEDSTGSTFN